MPNHNVTHMEYTKPSSKNPGLILFVIDVSKSMKDSKVHNDIIKTLPYLRSLGEKKPQTVKFVTIQFARHTAISEKQLEYSDISFTYNLGEQTNLPNAISKLQYIVENHVKNECTKSNPLINILFFTDGRSTPWLNRGFDSVTSNLHNLIEQDNIMLGIIDYDEISPLDELPSQSLDFDGIYKYRVARASALPKDLVEKAYKVEKQAPPVMGVALSDIFGPSNNLINKEFILSSKTVNRHPNVTTAFIKLGTFTMAEGLKTTTSSKFEIREREEYDI